MVALIDDSWQVLVTHDGKFVALNDIQHPRSVSYHHATRRLAWVGPDNRLRERNLVSGATRIFEGVEGSSYTQPAWSFDGTRLIVVELPEGKSRRTLIVSFELESGERHYLVRKRTAQFEPQLSDTRNLYYTTAICVDDCEGMIWELWVRDLQTAQQRQLTLGNAVATQPHLGHDGWLYYSSDAGRAGFHIWRMRPEPGAPSEQLTQGEVRDSDPVLGADGFMYFLRKSREGTALMRISATLEQVYIDADVSDLRDLEGGP